MINRTNRIAALILAIGLVGVAMGQMSETKPPAKGDKGQDFTLKTPDGQDVTLSQIEATGPVVLVVLRGWPGYQCPLCTRQVGELLGSADAFKAANATVLMVYPGPADKLKQHADEFKANKVFPEHFKLVIDPDYTFTNQWGLRWNAENETAYPSTFVLDRQNTIQFAKVSHDHGGRADTKEVVEVVKGLK